MIVNALVLAVGAPALKLLKLRSHTTLPLASSLTTSALLAGVWSSPVATYPPSEVGCTSLSSTWFDPAGPSRLCHCTLPWPSSLRIRPPTFWWESLMVPAAMKPPSLVRLSLSIALPLAPALYTRAHTTPPVELTFSTSAH